MAGGASSCSAARRRAAEPLCTDGKVVERQCQTSSCRTRSAACGQAGLCASMPGGGSEQHLEARTSSAEQHCEHRQDSAEARQPWHPSLAAMAATLQRRRRMDAAAHAGGPSHSRTLQLHPSPRPWRHGRGPSACRRGPGKVMPWPPGAWRVPRAEKAHMNLLSPFHTHCSWTHPDRLH